MAIQRVSDLSLLQNPEYKSDRLNNSLIEMSYPNVYNTEYTKYQSMAIRYKEFSDCVLSGVIHEEGVVFTGQKYFQNHVYFRDGIELSGDLLVNDKIPDNILRDQNEKEYHSYIKELNNTIIALSSNDSPDTTGINLLSADNSNSLYASNNKFYSNNNEFRDVNGNLIAGIYNDKINMYTNLNVEGNNVSAKSDHILYQSDDVKWKDSSGVQKAYFDGNNFHFNTDIYGCAMSARWADLAELYESDNIYQPGTLIMFGGEKEITIATDVVNAVITTKPAFIMNSNCKGNSQAIALIGRTPVRVVGKINKFDNIKISEIPGVAIKSNDKNDVILGKALQNKHTEDEGLVECVIRLTF